VRSPRPIAQPGATWSGIRGRAGQFAEAQHLADTLGRDISNAVAEPFSAAAESAAGHIHFKDNRCLHLAAVAFDDV
jgi:hypothetical protein